MITAAMRISSFLRLHHRCADEQPHALIHVLGDGILLHRSLFYRRLRARAIREGVRYVRSTELRPMGFAPTTAHIEFAPNVVPWTRVAKSRDVAATSLKPFATRNELVYPTASFVGRQALGKSREVSEATRVLLRVSFAEITRELVGLFHEQAHAERLAHWLNTQSNTDPVDLAGPFRVLENLMGSELAVAGLIACRAIAYIRRSRSGFERLRSLLDALGLDPSKQEAGANLLGAIEPLVIPTTDAYDVLAVRLAYENIATPLRRIELEQAPTIDAIRRLATTLTLPIEGSV